MLKIVIDNFLALRHFHWTPAEVCVLVGPNGAGKSTLFLALRFLKIAAERKLHEAAAFVLGGSSGLRNYYAGADEPITLGIDLDEISWRVRLIPSPPTVEIVDESLTSGSIVVYHRTGIGQSIYKGQPFVADERLGIRVMTDMTPADSEANRIASLLQGIGILMDLDLPGLRINGSRTEDYSTLFKDGQNAFTVLRYWHERRELKSRYEFVRDSLVAAFGGIFDDLDFDSTNGSVSVRFFHPGMEKPIGASHECNGLLAMLVQLCAIAAAPPGGLVCIDEPENSLHPFAIRQLVECASTWARQHNITVVFATHSPVLLDEMNGTPNEVFVLNPKTTEPQPVSLDKLKDPNWLSRFKLGDIYVDGEYGLGEQPVNSGKPVRPRTQDIGRPKKNKRNNPA